MQPSTLIPQRLSYGPVGSATSDQAHLLTFDEVTAPEFRGGRYEVCHYQKGALGGCVGPLAIDQMLWFGLELDTRLRDTSRPVVVQFEPYRRRNVAFVTGAYLVLGQGWSADEVRRALPEDAALTLPCSWIDPSALRTEHGAPRMTVQDCWEGVQMARDLGWLSRDSVKDGVVTSLAASKFWKTTCQYDGAWLVPGVVFVMADPMTTIKDPNPATCSAFCSERGADSEPEEEASLDELRGITKCTLDELLEQQAAGEQEVNPGPRRGLDRDHDGADDRDRDHDGTGTTAASDRDHDGADELRGFTKGTAYTVCKAHAAEATGRSAWPDARPFVDFLLKERIGAVVRVNRPDEQGLARIGGSYDTGPLAEVGIWHEEFPVSDSVRDGTGGVAPSGVVRRFVSMFRDIGSEDGSAVLVHCKGGFGRSVFLACLLVVFKYDVSGRGVLGWARIARPGAITTPEQEAVLRSLSGRGDLCKRYGIPREGRDGATTGRACCAVS